MMVELKNRGNPDMNENPYRPITEDDRLVPVTSFRHASEVCRQYIHDNSLGGGNWTGGDLTKEGEPVARVSYNGRVWYLNGQEVPEVEMDDEDADRSSPVNG
jgi:hypothetical protein